MKISKAVIGVTIGLCGFSSALANQLIDSPAYKPIAQATKNGTRFVADISSTDGSRIDIPTGGFIDSIYLHVEWDRLIGQPTEFYGLKWTMGDRVDIPTSEGGTVRQFPLSQLDKYPDLKARFLDLRPVDLKLSFNFGLGFNDSMNGLVNMTDGLKEPHFYTAQNHADGTKIVSRIPHLIIMGSEQQGTDFIPSSPRDWASFVAWEYGLATKAGQNTNLAAQNTFEQATQMWLSNLKVESVELPTSQMRAIYEEFQKREKAEEDKAKADAEAKKAEQIAKSAEEKLAAKMKQIEAQKAAEAKRQRELALKQSAEAKLAAKMKELSRKNALSQADAKKLPSTNITAKGFISKDSQSRTMGVVDVNNNVLIPFKNWIVLSYSEGVADIVMGIDTYVPLDKTVCGKAKNYPYGPVRLSQRFFKIGKVDQSGDWSEPPQIFGRVHYGGPKSIWQACQSLEASLNRELGRQGVEVMRSQDYFAYKYQYDDNWKNAKERER